MIIDFQTAADGSSGCRQSLVYFLVILVDAVIGCAAYISFKLYSLRNCIYSKTAFCNDRMEADMFVINECLTECVYCVEAA